MFKAAVLTVSDRSSQGQRPDAAGPLVEELLKRGRIRRGPNHDRTGRRSPDRSRTTAVE